MASESRYGNVANYNPTPATRTVAEPSALEVDISGNLLTSSSGGTFGVMVNPSSNFTRPTDTTSYAVGDLVANDTTNTLVTPMSWTAARIAAGDFYIRRARLFKSTNTVTNANFRLHLYAASPTPSNGDNAAWLTTISTYLGSMDVTTGFAFSDPGAGGLGVPNSGSEIGVSLASGQTIYGLLEARAAYAPGNAEVFTVILEVYQS